MGSSAVWVFLPLEVIIGITCCLGNVLVIWAVWTCGALRQPTFCFIVSLAVADFLVGSVVIPMGLLVDIGMNTSFYGCLFMCCVIIMLQEASIAFLLAIAVDRFLRVHIPLPCVVFFYPYIRRRYNHPEDKYKKIKITLQISVLYCATP